MATESPLLHDGGNTVAGTDMRNSTNTGTTHMGQNGSPQFQAVLLGTTARTVILATSGSQIYGVLQNKPNVGDAADVGIFGVTKIVAGATSVLAGGLLMVDSSGCAIAYSSQAGSAAIGRALEAPTAAGQIITAMIWGGGVGALA